MKDYFIRTYTPNLILRLDDNTLGILVIGKKYEDEFIYMIDPEDKEKVERYVWYYHQGYCTTGCYEGKQINLSNVIMGKPPEGYVVHHVNGDITDNRKANLRIVPYAANNFFKETRANHTTGIRGVHHYKRGSWVANHGSKKIHCKSFEEAIRVRKIYEDEMQKHIE